MQPLIVSINMTLFDIVATDPCKAAIFKSTCMKLIWADTKSTCIYVPVTPMTFVTRSS